MCSDSSVLRQKKVSKIINITYLHVLTYLLHGAESVLRSEQVCNQSRNSPHFMEPEGSLPHSQFPATWPYLEPARSIPYPHIPLPEDSSWYYPPIYAWVSPVVSFPQVSPPKPHTRYMPVHLISLDFIMWIMIDITYDILELMSDYCTRKSK